MKKRVTRDIRRLSYLTEEGREAMLCEGQRRAYQFRKMSSSKSLSHALNFMQDLVCKSFM